MCFNASIAAKISRGRAAGWPTVQRIINKHGGHIWAEAQLDKGATFYFAVGGSPSEALQAAETMALKVREVLDAAQNKNP